MTDKDIIDNLSKYKKINFKLRVSDEIKEYLKNRFNDSESYAESYYRILHNLEVRPTCKTCGNKVSFYTIKRGFAQYCCTSCSMLNKETTKKREKTCLKKYGTKAASASKEVQNKIKETCRKRYGVDNVFQSEEIKNKMKETCLEKYGYEYVSSSPEFKEKIKSVCQEKYGVDNVFQSEEIKNKMKETWKKHYGENIENPFQAEEIKNKIKETWKRNYGVDHPMLSNEYKEKIKQTNKRKYGYENVFSSPEIIKKIKFNKIKNGKWNYSELEEFLDKELTNRNIKFIREYKSDRYPFMCDFYLSELDVFIEIQGTWYHGGHIFDINNENDIKKLEHMKSKAKIHNSYESAIKIWTISDPNKRKIAKENNLKFFELWNKQDIIDWLEKLDNGIYQLI